MPDVKEQNQLTNNTLGEVQMLGLLDKELNHCLMLKKLMENTEKERKMVPGKTGIIVVGVCNSNFCFFQIKRYIKHYKNQKCICIGHAMYKDLICNDNNINGKDRVEWE